MVPDPYRIKIRTPPVSAPISLRAKLSLQLSSTTFRHSTTRIMGVTIETITRGDGINFPKKGDKVTIHYVGTLLDGKKFDSSRDRGSPFETEIGTGKVIKGWDEGVLQLSVGQKAIITATPDFAYGSRGFPPVIPPFSTLRFEVELIKIN
ncbi:hypothetical protein NLJ89_g9542 [Agrocybe chaxingu]|uniref:peptidylprolyl isomerase n=1 Tax=Agrocybe chaxingu TaxID=84603 RepID=A0A9W8JSI2_9AGAR|nr:hypothetical protein NLJ89_g9542 [Agrocybe chaxingu]